MTKGRIIIADIEKISCKEEWILSQIAQRYVEKYQKHKRETDKKQELIAGYLLKEYLGVENDAQLVMNKNGKPMILNLCVRIMKLQLRRYFLMKYKMQCLNFVGRKKTGYLLNYGQN